MADKKELQELRDTIALLADKIENDVIDTDTLIEFQEWLKLAEDTKTLLSKLIDSIDNAIDELEGM